MALTQNKPTKSLIGDVFERPVKAGEKIFTGAISMLLAGHAVVGKTAVGLVSDGCAVEAADNTNGADGDVTVRVARHKAFGFEGDGVTVVDIGKTAYVVDDETVAADNGGGTRSALGKIVMVDDLVWVQL